MGENEASHHLYWNRCIARKEKSKYFAACSTYLSNGSVMPHQSANIETHNFICIDCHIIVNVDLMQQKLMNAKQWQYLHSVNGLSYEK